jgi:hypothetical protein
MEGDKGMKGIKMVKIKKKRVPTEFQRALLLAILRMDFSNVRCGYLGPTKLFQDKTEWRAL